MDIDRLDAGLFRLNVPFEDLTTSVYFAVYDRDTAIIDSGTYPSDADEFILPALDAIGIAPAEVKYLLLTHHHGDHAGGVRRLGELLGHARIGAFYAADLPNFMQLKHNDVLLGALQVIHLPGHTDTSVGFFDVRTRTLLSGDCLQLEGIGRYRNGIADTGQYIESVKKLMGMDIHRIVAAHEYDPLGSIAQGTEEVRAYLEMCIRIAERKKGS